MTGAMARDSRKRTHRDRSGGKKKDRAGGPNHSSPGRLSKREMAAARSRRRMSPAASWTLLGVGIAVVVGLVVFVATRDTFDPGGTGVTDAAAFDLPALDDDRGDPDGDGRIRLADFAGTPTVVNFFASWCVECEDELPYFRDAAEELRGQVDFVFVNANERSGGSGMASEFGLWDFPVARDIGGNNRNGLVVDLGGNRGMPLTAYYSAEGELLDVDRGAVSEARLIARLQAFEALEG